MTRRKRANSRARLLSARALKAWKTRRANGWVHPASRPKKDVKPSNKGAFKKPVLSLADVLSARALKAWETRRANGWVHPANRSKKGTKKALVKPSKTVAGKVANKAARKPVLSLADVLSARALKAWETRRANGWVHPASR